MNQEKTILSDTLYSWQNAIRNNLDGEPVTDDELPLRSELFSAAQMAAHGKHLAARHQLSKRGGPDRLLARLTENAAIISGTCAELTAAIKAGRQITPASEWMLDNFYLIEEQIRTARRHLPKDYSKELPRLANEEAEGNPRVYQIALEIISHGDGRVDPESLSRFVDAYQDVAPLKLGELWAIPIMLRLALIENLRRVAARVYENRMQRDRANTWADQMSETAEKNPSDLILLVADMARSRQPMNSGFVAELARRLQGQSSALTLALQWVTTRLADVGLTIEQQIQAEIQQQAADQVTISNSIGSLRFLGTMDWREFVETMSAVEQTLRCDPADTYGKMDFATRDNYRHIIEQLAKRCSYTEVQVAEQALELAQANREPARGGLDMRTRHIGYYLVGSGLPALEKKLAVRYPAAEMLGKIGRGAPLATYLGAIALFTALFTASVVLHAWEGGLEGGLLVLLGVMAAIGSSQLALALVNFMATQLTKPHPLPRMDFKEGIPDDARTMVVVPSMLFTADNVGSLCEALEVRYLANRDPGLRFCLLTDFADAPNETMPEDAELLSLARAAIRQLNAKYRDPEGPGPVGLPMLDGVPDIEPPAEPFLLLHRPRVWSEGERAWIGYERKRGKLADLNAFLRGGARDKFSVVEGELNGLLNIRYVITLDTDTQLPRDSARQFVATMAHPLNQPQLDAAGRRVVEGYGILQPRVSASLPSENASRYERLCGGEPGIDPYTRTVSDVYQDVFYEGSFIGKGIYDVDTFERLLGHRLPDNQVLSHDLLEGCYLRAGLLSDAQLYETYPSRYSDDVSRRHRWIRGDWQLAGWLRPKVPAAGAKRESNPLSALSLWKLFDNLRRSVVAPVLTALLLLCWARLPSPWFWSAAILSVIFLPTFVSALVGLIEKPHDMRWRQHMASGLSSLKIMFGHAVLQATFLPYEAWFSLDAIVRTGWRMLVTRRNLLEWRPSSLARSSTNMETNWQRMWFSPALAVGAALMLSFYNPGALFAAAPVLLLWFMAPVIAWWISLPMARETAELSPIQSLFLHTLARKTWGFFEDFVGAEDNWLPPDNMQEHPAWVVAHRTSPTNMGMSLLANLTAHDFGFATLRQVLERTGATFATMDRMERHHGHFYNWYDTISLVPLHPMYVSSVDSGNLAGHLLTLAPGLSALADQPIAGARTLDGIGVTLQVVAEHAADAAPAVRDAIGAMQDQLGERLREAHTLPGLAHALDMLCDGADAILAALALAPAGEPHLQGWAGKLAAHSRGARDELLELAPWMKSAQEYVVDSSLTRIPTLRELAGFGMTASPSSDLAPNERSRQHALTQLVAEGSAAARRRLDQIADLVTRARQFADMDFSFLYNTTTNLLAIGYNVSDRRLDASCYDLLASEVRLASFVGIAQGQFPQEHWFALGRQLCVVGGEQLLLSWSGSMFEYLMPLLVMPSYQNTLLDQTYRAIINAQVDYARQRGVPWGISESGYNTVDANLNYQYRAFGVPGTGMKRGLADDLVVAPYATMLGLMVDAEASCENLQRMHGMGFMGKYGFYEAIDYTTARLPRGQDFAVIRSFMAHHQGMGFLALSYLLHDRPMQRRFESDPLFQATMLVLQERVPKAGAFHSHTADLAAMRAPVSEVSMPMRIITTASTAQPEVQLLSNGRYHVMITSAGGSYSRWKDLSVTRWREDATADNWGNFCYVRDVDSGAFWSTTFQPTLVEPKKYEVIFSEGRAEFRRNDRGLDLYTEIVVSPEDDIEMRRTRITNKSNVRRTIEFTSYAEVVMAPAAADAAHPAFSKLFVQTEILRNENAILCTRRPRTKDEHMPWLLNLMTVHDGVLLDASFETSRADFIGRANSTVAPRALLEPQPLAGGEGSVLDPVVAIRYKLTLEPDQVVVLDVVTGMTETREAALHLIDKYQDRHLADRVFELAWTHSQVVLRQLNATESDAQLYSRLASSIIYPNAALRADASILIRNHRGQSGLWAYAISGDLPIVLMQIKDPANIELARQMVQAHAYWRLKGLVVDLVIWYEDNSGYRQALHDQIMGLIASGIDAQAIDRPGGIFVRLLDQISPEDRVLMQSVARAILSDARGSLADQIKRAAPVVPKLPLGVFEARAEPYTLLDQAGAPPAPALILDNGIGGFSADGREYVIRTDGGSRTPAPWANVLANPSFGSVVSESGQAYTWSENAHEFRLTPWHNDPVSDAGGEAFYIRDEATGRFWSPTALPVRANGEYTTRHGFGYSVFEHTEEAIHSALTTFVALDAPIKYSVVRLRNDSSTPRRLSVTGYVEWVLGDLRSKSSMHVVTELDPLSGALFARNAYNTEFTGRVGFFQVEAQNKTITADRNEFVGRNRNLANPAAMNRARLSGKIGAGLDPCAAIQVVIELQPGQERELVFMLGVGGRRNADASGMVQRYNGSSAAQAAFDMVRDHWDATLGAVRIETPDPTLDVIANGWLMYQTIACRMWARSGYYQSGGAFGFRDQLQDAMAMIHTQPQILREHLLLCAAHQFVEGDVQHWWHPPSDRGVRTHCSDDYLWLPLATHRYVVGTGDRSVLTEPAPFLEGRMLTQEEESYYDMPGHSHQNADLYEHCVRAIKRGLRFGVHGLPLIGTCDWNDGMDRVGNEGKGESVWLAWFLFDVLTKFAEVAVLHDDQAFADTCRNEARQLAHNVEVNAWDGKWYRRAYFDDGTPLGSSTNDECQIDSISQSWGVLSGAADPARTASAMHEVDQRLVRRDFGLVQLLDPPFDKGVLNPGYIRGYVPGVRENGGQYTHAAIWTAMAFARMGDSAKAWELLRMINPVHHSASPEGSALYKVEPYVVAADVYAVSPHIGRGGWSWYTGSSGWMYRLIVESLLGLGLAGDQLTIAPHLPAEWNSFKLHYRYRTANYAITVMPGETAALTLDGQALEGNAITLADDGRDHVVELRVLRPVPMAVAG